MKALPAPALAQTKGVANGEILDCAGKIVGLVSTGAIVVGRRVGESSLASQLKVSRALVRSALDHLETVGLMERRPRSGTFLREISFSEYCEVMDIRAALEAVGASRAALCAEKKELRELIKQADGVDALNKRWIKGEVRILPKLIRLDLKFHLALAALSGNGRLVATLRQERLIETTFALASQKLAMRFRRDRPIPSHREVAEAVASGNSDLAAQIIKQHILRTREARLGFHSGEIK